MQVTQWFEGDVKPVRIGFYQVEPSGRHFKYAYWNGKIWSYYFYSIKDLKKSGYHEKMSNFNHESLVWRGIAKDE